MITITRAARSNPSIFATLAPNATYYIALKGEDGNAGRYVLSMFIDVVTAAAA